MKLLRGHEALAAWATLLLLLVVIIVPVLLLAGQVFNETTSAYHHLAADNNSVTSTLSSLQEQINANIEQVAPGITLDFGAYITSASAWLLQNVGSFFSGTLSVGLRLFLGLFAFYYFVKDGKKFLAFFDKISLLPVEHTHTLLRKLKAAIRSIIGGSIIIAILQAVVAGIGYVIFGLPNPALWGTLTGLAGLVPGLGTAIILVPAVIYLFITGTLVQGIGLAIWGIICVGLIDNFITPKLLGSGLNIHPMVILFAIIGGLSFFGPEGFLLGPLVIALFLALFDIYHILTKPPAEQEQKEVINEEAA